MTVSATFQASVVAPAAVERRSINLLTVVAALFLIAAAAVYLGAAVSGRQALLFLVGTGAGVVLYHAAFGFTSSWRDFLLDGRGAGIRAQMVMLALTWPFLGDVQFARLPPSVWAALFWALVVCSFIGWLLWTWVNSVRGIARSAPFMYLMPPVAGLMAWLTLGETFTLLKLSGAAITMGGVALAQLSGQQQRLTTMREE